MRKRIIAGNWKMNKTSAETIALINEIKPLIKGVKTEVVVCVPFTALFAAKKAIKGSRILLGAQNIAYSDSGAYTGEVSAEMLTEFGVKYAIIGHSERRQFFGETDDGVNKRVIQSLKCGIRPIICIGETESEREEGQTNKVLAHQVAEAFKGVSELDAKNIVVAYEPVWAIGTGKTATAEDANSAIKFIRNEIKKVLGSRKASNAVRIQYGGSMNAKNADSLLAMSDIDGGLIGGASLKADDFAKIVTVE